MHVIGMKIDEVRIDGRMDCFQKDLEELNYMGIEAVELPVHGMDVILNGQINHRRMDQVLEILKPFKFRYSVHSPNPLNLMDKEEPQLHADVLAASLEFARQVGAKAVVVHSGRFIPEEIFTLSPVRDIPEREKRRLLAQEARILQEVCALYPDVTVALENARPYLSQSPYCYAERLDSLKAQVRDVNRDNVRINLDFGHLFMCARFYDFDPMAEVSQIRGLVAHTHIHDNFGGAVHHFQKQQTHQLPLGKGDSHMPVGWGRVPIAGMLQQILPEYEGLFMMELRSRYFNDIQESKLNLAKILMQMNQCENGLNLSAGIHP